MLREVQILKGLQSISRVWQGKVPGRECWKGLGMEDEELDSVALKESFVASTCLKRKSPVYLQLGMK